VIPFDLILKLVNLLLFPILYFIIKFERRMTRIETLCSLHMQGKVLVDEKDVIEE